MAAERDRCWIAVSENDLDLVVRIGGELDLATRASIEPAVFAAVGASESVVLDLSELTFCDSGGIALFIRAHDQATAKGSRLALREPSAMLRRLIEITGLEVIIPVVGTARSTVGSTSRNR
jgi:anti-sigma B factor antagonist